MQKTFYTPGPTSLYVEIGSGSVNIHATETTDTEVQVQGRDADLVTVEQHGEEIVVKSPPRHGGFLGFGGDLTVTVRFPNDSDLVTRVGSADVRATGRLATVRVKSGSGEVTIEETTADAVLQSGSGGVEISRALGDLRIKTGSGSVQVGRAAVGGVIVSGSGRITVDSAEDETVAKTGSGDVRIANTNSHVALTSGSGDLEVGSVSRGLVKAKTASGSVLVGVPAGIPVWTDISVVTGRVRSNLEGAGEAAEGQDHIEIRATTVSGDVTLTQL